MSSFRSLPQLEMEREECKQGERVGLVSNVKERRKKDDGREREREREESASRKVPERALGPTRCSSCNYYQNERGFRKC